MLLEQARDKTKIRTDEWLKKVRGEVREQCALFLCPHLAPWFSLIHFFISFRASSSERSLVTLGNFCCKPPPDVLLGHRSAERSYSPQPERRSVPSRLEVDADGSAEPQSRILDDFPGHLRLACDYEELCITRLAGVSRAIA